MIRTIVCVALAAFLSGAISSQSVEKLPGFVVADIHPSPPATNILNQAVRGPYIGGGRYELLSATVLDMIRVAYRPSGGTLDVDKVVGGPNWLDFDRFDVIAKAPEHSSTDSMKLMLQSLLAERFKLVIKDDTRPVAASALTVGKKLALREADGTEETGCKLQSQSSAPAVGDIRININGTALVLGPGSMLTYACRNITMAAFADGIRSMIFASVNTNNNRVVDQTELKGAWNFDLKFSLPLRLPGSEPGDLVTFTDAVQKVGLEFVPARIPTSVKVIESANEKPTPNPPGIAEALPPLPEEFEVADIKPTAPDFRGGKYQVLPSGRVDIQGQTLKTLIQRAWGLWPALNDDMLAGPKFMETARFDIIAKAATYGPPPDAPGAAPGTPAPQLTNLDAINPMLRHLLIERFGLTFHNEERPVNAFKLTAVKAKLQKADPANRTGYHEGPGPDGKDPRAGNPNIGRLVTFQNMTMAQFAINLPRVAGGYLLGANVADATGIEGAWDFTLSFSTAGAVTPFGGARGGDAGGGAGAAGPQAADPGGLNLYEALEKQLGLKLEQTKRPASVMVIDHLEEKPKQP